MLAVCQGRTNKAIAQELGLCGETVGVWRKRWPTGGQDLQKLEQKPKHLRAAISALLADLPRPGCPATFTAEQICQIIAIACEKPPEHLDHWTRPDLVREAIQRGIVEGISETSVGRFLNQVDLKPHRSRYWLNHEVEDPVAFPGEVRTVCKLYHQAQELHEQEIHLISTDEKTGIQALERLHPPV